MIDFTATDVDVGIALNLSGMGVTERTLTATIDITHRGTAVQHVAGIRVAQILHLVTSYLAITDVDVGVSTNESHLTRTIDAGAHLGVFATNGHLGVRRHLTAMVLVR